MHRLASTNVILYFILLAVLEGTVMPAFQIRAVYPSLLYLFVCYAAFSWGDHHTVYVAFWSGLLRDFMGGGLIGVEATLLVALSMALSFLVHKTERGILGVYYLVVFLFIFFAGALHLLLSAVGGSADGAFPGILGSDFFLQRFTQARFCLFLIL